MDWITLVVGRLDHTLMKLFGDWKSNAYLLYEQVSQARRLELPEAMKQAILSGKTCLKA